MNIRQQAVGLIFLLWLGILAGCDNNRELTFNSNQTYAATPGKELKLVIATDTHYLAKSLSDKGAAFQKFIAGGDGKELGYSEEMVDAFVADVHKQQPDIVILSGDLTNNGEKKSHLDLAEKLSMIENSGTQVYVIPGNHDIDNPWARKFNGINQNRTDTINASEFSQIYNHFGYDTTVSRDRKTLSYLAAPSKRLWLLMLDTNQYQRNQQLKHPQMNGKLSRSTLKWIGKCTKLAAKHDAVLIPVMHHSLLNHSDYIHKGYTIDNNEDVLYQFRKNQISVVLSGHIHIQDISSSSRGNHPVYDIGTNALSVYPHQYGVIAYNPNNRMFNYDTVPLSVQKWAAENSVKDENLLHFESYSRDRFGNRAYQMSYKKMVNDVNFRNYSKPELEAMSRILQMVNLKYFAGRQKDIGKEITDTKGYQLWMSAPPSSYKIYMDSMVNNQKDNNHLNIHLSPIKP